MTTSAPTATPAPSAEPATPAPAAAPAPKAAEPKAPKPNPADVVKAVPKRDQVDDAPEKKVRVRGYQRAVKVKEALAEAPETTESESESTAERPSADEQPAKPAAASAVDSGAEAAAQARADRNKRIADIRARHEAEQQKRAQEAKGRESSGELERLRKRVAELEPNESVFSSEEALLEAAEKRGLGPDKLIQWMRTKLSDPQAVAKREAQTLEQKVQAKIDAEFARLKTERDAFEATQREAREAAEGQQRARQFVSMSSEKATTHPLTAQFLKARGEQHLVALASAVIVPYLPENYDVENLHDHIEQYLEYVSVGGPHAAGTAAPSGQEPPPRTNGAAKPVTTLSNDLGSRRESVAEELPLHRIPRSERIARVKRQLGGA